MYCFLKPLPLVCQNHVTSFNYLHLRAFLRKYWYIWNELAYHIINRSALVLMSSQHRLLRLAYACVLRVFYSRWRNWGLRSHMLMPLISAIIKGHYQAFQMSIVLQPSWALQYQTIQKHAKQSSERNKETNDSLAGLKDWEFCHEESARSLEEEGFGALKDKGGIKRSPDY